MESWLHVAQKLEFVRYSECHHIDHWHNLRSQQEWIGLNQQIIF